MKSKLTRVLSMMLLCFLMQTNAQSELFSDYNLNKKEIKTEDFTNLEVDSILDDFKTFLENRPEMSTRVLEPQIKPEDLIFAMQMAAIGAGIAFDEDETIWCLQAAYYYRLKLFQRSALYASLGAAYEGLSTGNQTQSRVDLQLRLLMFQTISQFNEIRFIYGLLGAYGFGKDKYDNFSTNITRVTLAVVMGIQLMLSAHWSVALQTNIATHNALTYKPENGEKYKNDFTKFLINKNNLLTLTLFFNLGK